MRITNKIMRSNSLYNINLNKILEDKLNNQMTSQSKISRPSDDPVVAIRALRLRTNVSTITQYYDKNAPDADQWLQVTGDALNTLDKIYTDLYTQATDASKKSLTSDDLEIILTQMKSLTKELYSSGNVDYAGRYVFSGYRTDTPITFTAKDIKEFEEHLKSFEINEKFGYEDISTISYTDWSALTDPDNYPNPSELDISNTTLYRIRLSYNDLKESDTDLSLTINEKKIKHIGGITDPSDPNYDPDYDPDYTYEVFNSIEDAYKAIQDKDCKFKFAYIPSTGEIVFSEATFNYAEKDDTTGVEKKLFPEGCSIGVTYTKDSWKEGDLNPVHYFDCTSEQDGVRTSYNAGGDIRQDIFYDVGFNQKIQVNTLASEVFTHDVQRDIDDFQYYLKQLKDIEATITDYEKKRDECSEDSQEYKNWQLKIDAANKAYTYIRDNLQTKFENQMTKYQKYQEANNVAITQNGTRGSRLELISDRLMIQKATFEELQTSNEGVDTTEIAVELKSAELTYEAALLATSKIMQTSLMNYI